VIVALAAPRGYQKTRFRQAGEEKWRKITKGGREQQKEKKNWLRDVLLIQL
jgi:hypothetical protein